MIPRSRYSFEEVVAANHAGGKLILIDGMVPPTLPPPPCLLPLTSAFLAVDTPSKYFLPRFGCILAYDDERRLSARACVAVVRCVWN